MVQLGRGDRAAGRCAEDFWIINEPGRRIGLTGTMRIRAMFNEMRTCMDSIAGITWDRLERESSVTYPCVEEGDPGDPVVFIETFPTPSGRGKFVPADLISAAEQPNAEVPDGADHRPAARTLAYRIDDAPVNNLDAIEPEPVVDAPARSRGSVRRAR